MWVCDVQGEGVCVMGWVDLWRLIGRGKDGGMDGR